MLFVAIAALQLPLQSIRLQWTTNTSPLLRQIIHLSLNKKQVQQDKIIVFLIRGSFPVWKRLIF